MQSLALAGLPGCMLVSGDGALPDGVISRATGSKRPPGMAGDLWQPGRWRRRASRPRDDRWWLRRAPYRPRGSGSRCSRSLDSRHRRSRKAQQQAEEASRAQETLTQELAAAQAGELRQDLTAQLDSLRTEAAAAADELAPLDEEFERTDAAYRDAQAEQRTLDRRRAEVSAHLAAMPQQLTDQEQPLQRGRCRCRQGADHRLDQAPGHLHGRTAGHPGRRAAGHDPLDLPGRIHRPGPRTG